MSDKRRPRGTGSVREWNGRVQARYTFFDAQGHRRERSKLFDTRTEARGWLTDRLAEVAGGSVADARSITLGEYLGHWLGSLGMAQLEAATLSWYRSAVERHIVPQIGHVRLDRITPVMVEAFLSERASSGRLRRPGDDETTPKGLGPSSVRRLTVTLHKALDAAVRKGMLARNPVDSADKPKMPASDVTLDVWAPDEIAAFLQATRQHRLAAVWRTAAMTGLRRSEVCGLQWGDLDLETGRLSVRRAIVSVDGRPHVKPPKTAKSRRTVELDAGTVAILREWRKSQLEERLRAGEVWEAGEWVVADELGRFLRPDHVGRLFSRLVASAGLRPITFRKLRHSHATALLVAGEAPKVVQERLGHASITMTMDIYSAVLPNMQRDAVERLASMMEAQ